MKTLNLETLLKVAAVMHLGLLWAGALMPGVVGLRNHTATLPPFVRRLFWVYYTFLGFCLLSFGALTFAFADVLASGAPVARGLCAFFAVFWTLRLAVATFVFDLRPYLTSPFRRVGYQATNIVFAYLPFVYAWAALKGVI
jgi:hypothetical protein